MITIIARFDYRGFFYYLLEREGEHILKFAHMEFEANFHSISDIEQYIDSLTN